jgi:hypothetical protein
VDISDRGGNRAAAKLRRLDYITVVYFGDGATDRGDFHESSISLRFEIVSLCLRE